MSMKNTKYLLVALFFAICGLYSMFPKNTLAQSTDQAAQNTCKSYKDDTINSICQNAYKKAAGGGAEKGQVCNQGSGEIAPYLPTSLEACNKGFDAGLNAKQTADTPSAESACKDAGFSGSQLIDCKKGYLAAKARKSKDDTCKDVKPAKNKQACEQGFSLAGVVTDTESQDNQPNCENTKNSLSFVVCPLLDGIANTSDWVFSTVIQPLLQNVPVSTDTSDPSYKAWQGFRVIANIVLIGALLAVVFYQARGGQ